MDAIDPEWTEDGSSVDPVWSGDSGEITSLPPEGSDPGGERAPGWTERERVRRPQRPACACDHRGDAAGVRPRPEVRVTAVQRRVRRLAGRGAWTGSAILRRGQGGLSRHATAPPSD